MGTGRSSQAGGIMRCCSLFLFYQQVKNMWKFPGGLSEPGEDIGAYLKLSLGWKPVGLLSCTTAESSAELSRGSAGHWGHV